MAYQTNPFLERMSERMTSDLEFVRLFSPKILEKLSNETFDGGVHIFRSAPGAGKTTLLRAFTPPSLRGFWASRKSPELVESFQKLVKLGVLKEQSQNEFLGVLLSCASGYADLPPGANIQNEGLFRALFDCRTVLKTLRSLGTLLGCTNPEDFEKIEIEYDFNATNFKNIPSFNEARELIDWAEKTERKVYAQLDAFSDNGSESMPVHVQFESVVWLREARFFVNQKEIALKRLLMVDDLHKLRKAQRSLLIEELTEQRSTLPVWLAERSIVLGDTLLSQGAREGRDVHEHRLEDLWSTSKNSAQFIGFAQSILDRRMVAQDLVPTKSFSQCLRQELDLSEISSKIEKGISLFQDKVKNIENRVRYSEWLERAKEISMESSLESLFELYITRILLARDQQNQQLSFDMALPADEIEDRGSSAARGAAAIFMHEELKIPYYFGLERLCVMASANIEELLTLAAALFTGMQNKLVLRNPDPILTPLEQEKLLKEAAKRKRDFIPRNHTEGKRAQKLIDSIGLYCRQMTFLPNAPVAPGVTGIRLSSSELKKLESPISGNLNEHTVLKRVLSECAAENLLIVRESSASTSREHGSIFYLNRTLCAHFNLPLQLGGWKDVSVQELAEWMETGYVPRRQHRLRTN